MPELCTKNIVRVTFPSVSLTKNRKVHKYLKVADVNTPLKSIKIGSHLHLTELQIVVSGGILQQRLCLSTKPPKMTLKLIKEKDHPRQLPGWTSRSTIQPLEFIMSKHVFLPSIGHVGQSKTSDPASASGRCDKVYESVTRAVTVADDKRTNKDRLVKSAHTLIHCSYGVAVIRGKVCSRSSLAMGKVITIGCHCRGASAASVQTVDSDNRILQYGFPRF